MDPKLVGCFRFQSETELLAIISNPAVSQDVDVLEVRLDYLSPQIITPSLISLIQTKSSKDVILTIHSQNENTEEYYPLSLKQELYQQALSHNFAYIDIELKDWEVLIPNLEISPDTATRFIQSSHNEWSDSDGKHIPSPKGRLMQNTTSALSNQEIIYKRVFHLHSASEAAQLERMQFEIWRQHPETKWSLFGMGEHGLRSRVIGHQFGNVLTYLTLPNLLALSLIHI